MNHSKNHKLIAVNLTYEKQYAHFVYLKIHNGSRDMDISHNCESYNMSNVTRGQKSPILTMRKFLISQILKINYQNFHFISILTIVTITIVVGFNQRTIVSAVTI